MSEDCRKIVDEWLKHGEYGRAEAYLAAKLSAEPDNQELRLLHAVCRLLQGDAEAFRQETEDVRRAPGQAAELLGRLSKASQYLLLPSLIFAGATSCEAINPPQTKYAGPPMEPAPVVKPVPQPVRRPDGPPPKPKYGGPPMPPLPVQTKYAGPQMTPQPVIVRPQPQPPVQQAVVEEADEQMPDRAQIKARLAALQGTIDPEKSYYLANRLKELQKQAKLLEQLGREKPSDRRIGLEAVLKARIAKQENQIRDISMRCVYAGPGYMEQARARQQKEANAVRNQLGQTQYRLEQLKRGDAEVELVYTSEWVKLAKELNVLEMQARNQ